MKKLTILAILISAASIFITGCEGIDAIRANPISLEVNGDYLQNRPDTNFTHKDYIFSTSVYQAPDEFIFTMHDTLYGKRKRRCILNLTFEGIGSIQTGQRYMLKVSDEEAGTETPQTFSYNSEIIEITDGWIEFSEYGINSNGTRAYVSGTFGLTAKDKSIKITNGSFGRLLECKHNYVTEK